MKQAGFTFEIQVSKKEEVYQSERPDEIVEELSLLKAEDVAQSLEQENVIVIRSRYGCGFGWKDFG